MTSTPSTQRATERARSVRSTQADGPAPLADPTFRRVDCSACPGFCCKNDMIILHPELGDDAASYQTVAITHPLTGKPALMLDHKPNGDCIYLGEGGCTIHGRHPAICRKYDCGDNYATMTRAERRRYVAEGLLSKPQLDQGRRVHLARQSA